jgi:hypothetical protein
MRTGSRLGPWIAAIAATAALAALAGCGDNADTGCDPEPPKLPTAGPLRDPYEAPLADCVPGGLRDLPGRWFVAAAGAGFSYDYPRFEGSCEAGFRRSFRDDDLDASDGATRHTWSDGTRIFVRSYIRFELQDSVFEYADTFTACMRRGGTLAAHRTLFDTDRGARQVPMTGEPFAPRDTAPAGLRLVGELGRQNGKPMPAYNLVIDGTRAIVIGPTGLDTIDVSNPSAPVHLGHHDGSFNDVRVVHGGGKVVAYAAPIEDKHVAVIDVTDPAHLAAAPDIPEYAHSLQVQERGGVTYLYLANYTNDVPRYDVSSPLLPERTGQAHTPGPEAGIHDLTVDGDRLFVNNTREGVVALDVSGGLAAAVELGRRKSAYSHAGWIGTAGGRRVLLHGDEGMTADGGAYLGVLDGDPASSTFMQEIGSYRSRKQVGIHNFELVGNKVYIAYYHDGVRVVDLSDPTAPKEVAHHPTWNEPTAYGGTFEGAIGIRVVGGRIYVADLTRGLLIFEETPAI